MRFKQANPHQINTKYRLYSPSKLTKAYIDVKESGMSVLGAARLYQIPVNTLRDRVVGRIDPETVNMGKAPLFTQLEEVNIVNHFKTMASYGYGYTLQEAINIASSYAVVLGKRTNDKPLTSKWLRGFRSRWPEVKKFSPRALDYARAKMTKETVVNDYFTNLKQCIEKHDLVDKPHLIYNIDEKGMSVNHKPPHILASAEYTPSAVTAGKGNTVTMIGGGSASGNAVPPFFVFPGKRMNYNLLDGASPGATGTVSDSGWSNGVVFRTYLEDHFLKFVPGRNEEKILLIMDGHASHISVGLVEWARSKNIIIFILPAHTSHLLQPLDVSCFGAFEVMYSHKCHAMTRETSTCITRFNICKIACGIYTKSLRSENLISGFRKIGIYPLERDVIPKEKLVPAEVFDISDNMDQDADYNSDVIIEGGRDVAELDDSAQPIDMDAADDEEVQPVNEDADELEEVLGDVTMFAEIENKLKKAKSEQGKKKRKTVYKIVSGKEITNEATYKALMLHESQKKKPKQSVNDKKVKSLVKPKSLKKQSRSSQKIQTPEVEPQPGPSHINLLHDSSEDTESDICDEEKCCVCGLFTPTEVSKSTSLIFTKWAQCDKINNGKPCNHWTHLIYCSKVRVIRRGDKFYCPHCTENEE